MTFNRILIIFPIIIIGYLFSAIYSIHQIHKGIYYNDKNLIREYVDWRQLRENLKYYLNIKLLEEIKKDKNFKDLGSLGLLITGFASEIVDNILDTYVNSEGLSKLIDRNGHLKNLPKPSFETFIGGAKIMEFTNHSSFKINHVIDKKEISLLIQRTGIDWKITQIVFPDDLFQNFNKSYLNKIQNPLLNY